MTHPKAGFSHRNSRLEREPFAYPIGNSKQAQNDEEIATISRLSPPTKKPAESNREPLIKTGGQLEFRSGRSGHRDGV
jgi:hypothetical protein